MVSATVVVEVEETFPLVRLATSTVYGDATRLVQSIKDVSRQAWEYIYRHCGDPDSHRHSFECVP